MIQVIGWVNCELFSLRGVASLTVPGEHEFHFLHFSSNFHHFFFFLSSTSSHVCPQFVSLPPPPRATRPPRKAQATPLLSFSLLNIVTTDQTENKSVWHVFLIFFFRTYHSHFQAVLTVVVSSLVQIRAIENLKANKCIRAYVFGLLL